jgi:indolepyruvate ferredoxin oxidoreductase
MATFMPERRTETFTQMGGEGVPWIGQAPFTDETHLFANLGDGTYFHSGHLAIRASIAAGVNITYKILFNDAVAMTGGQPVDGTLSVPKIVAQMAAEGASKIVVVTDEPEKYEAVTSLPQMAGIEIHHRDHLDWLQKQMREVPGCSILIYDQTCASEKRRRRKKVVDGKPGFPDPARRVIINEAVCEGCGDCSVQSSCVSVEPVQTEFGRKRRINQSSCNKDFSCLKGFCPSFVTVEGGQLRKGAGEAPAADRKAMLPASFGELPEPQRLQITSSGNRTYGILVTGVGGTGVVTIGQLLGMAAHLEGKGVSVLDMAGLAQKGGAVFSHVQIAHRPDELFSTRIATGEADLVIGCDLVVSASNDALAKMRPAVTRAIINADVAPTSDFLRDPDWTLPADALKRNLIESTGESATEFVDATSLAVQLMGDAIYANPMLLGYAWQKGFVPLERQALERAIELNGIAVASNLDAFVWGRRIAHDRNAVAAYLDPKPGAKVIELRRPNGLADTDHASRLDRLIEGRIAHLTAYQNAAWASRYAEWVQRVRRAEGDRVGASGQWRLTEAVAEGLSKLMSYKDEYEVARLHADPAFIASIRSQFEGDWTLKFHLAPPIFSRIDPKTGVPAKRQFGSWILSAMRLLAKMKFVRGKWFDPFARTLERSTERALIGEYELLIDELLVSLSPANHELAIELARMPEQIRGFGHVKEAQLVKVRAQWEDGLARWQGKPSRKRRDPIPIRSIPA